MRIKKKKNSRDHRYDDTILHFQIHRTRQIKVQLNDARVTTNLSTVPPGQHNEDGARHDTRPEAPLVQLEGFLSMAQEFARHVFRGVETRLKQKRKT